MSIEETIEARKFRVLGISKEDFDKLPIEDRIVRLQDFKEELSSEESELLTTSSDARRRIAELEDHVAGTYTTLADYEERVRRIEGLRTIYRIAVHNERSEIGRLGAYTRWYRVFRARREFERAARYADLISSTRERLLPLVAEVARIRAELRTLPRLERLQRQIDDMRAVIPVYSERIRELVDTRYYATRRLSWIGELIQEINRELEELKVEAKIVRHRYRELSVAITAAIQYPSERKGGEAGHDIDIESHLDFTVKSLLPTRYTGNETAWIDEIQEVIRNESCKLLKECSDEYIETIPWDKILPEGWTCNIVGRRIVKRTVANVSKFYADLVPPINKKALASIFRNELERYCYISSITISVLRANVLHDTKTPCYGAQQTIGDCMNRRRDEIINSVVNWDVSEEIDELMRYLSE